MKLTTSKTAASVLALSAATALLLLGPSGAAGQCISDTTDIFDAENAVGDPLVLREYVLCPNTTFDIGTFDTQTNSYVGGMAAFEILNPNIHILCGADGKRGNNCVMQGGEQHVFASSTIFQNGLSLSNVLVSGVTFKDADLRIVQAAAATEGEDGIVFRDCLFQEANDVMAIVDALTFPSQNIAPLGMTVTLDSCTFDSNSIIPAADDAGVAGLVWNIQHKMKIINCEFINNRAVVAADADLVTWVIGNFVGGVMEVKDCFFKNNTVNVGLIYEEQVGAPDSIGEGTTTLSENIAMGSTFFPTATTDESCDGLASHITSNPFEVDCTKFSSSFPPTSAPTTETAMPTMVPTAAPVVMTTTGMPTMAPVAKNDTRGETPGDVRSGAALAMGGAGTMVTLLLITVGTVATAMGGWC